MKKIEVREYEPMEQIVIVYELTNANGVNDYNETPDWRKIDLFDPILKHDSNCNVGYFGNGPATLAKIIVETFRDYGSSKAYTNARNKIEEFLSKISNENNTIMKNFVITEKDVEHLI